MRVGPSVLVRTIALLHTFLYALDEKQIILTTNILINVENGQYQDKLLDNVWYKKPFDQVPDFSCLVHNLDAWRHENIRKLAVTLHNVGIINEVPDFINFTWKLHNEDYSQTYSQTAGIKPPTFIKLFGYTEHVLKALLSNIGKVVVGMQIKQLSGPLPEGTTLHNPAFDGLYVHLLIEVDFMQHHFDH